MAPGADHAAAGTELQDAIRKLTNAVGEISSEYNKFVSSFNTTLTNAAYVSPAAALLLQQKLPGKRDELNAKLNQLIAEINQFLDASTPVVSLIKVSERWNAEVLPELSAMVGVARDIRPNALHVWGGEAGRAYMEKRWAQRDGLQGLTDIVKDTGQWLVNVAALNTELLLELIEPARLVVKAIREAAIEAGTVFGLLEAIDTVASGIADSTDSIVEILAEITAHTVDSINKLTEARIILNNNDLFPGGKWPQAVSRQR